MKSLNSMKFVKGTDITKFPFKGEMVPAPPFYPQNIVTTWTCGLPFLNLTRDSQTFLFQLNSEKFAAALCRIKEPRSTNALFTTGKVVTTGSRSEMEAILSAWCVAELYQKKGYGVFVNDFSLQNVVCSAYINFNVNLTQLYEEIRHNFVSQYEPETFPGLILRLEIQGVTLVFLIFAQGKLVITGSRKMTTTQIGFNYVYNYFLLPLQNRQNFQNTELGRYQEKEEIDLINLLENEEIDYGEDGFAPEPDEEYGEAINRFRVPLNADELYRLNVNMMN